MSWLFFPQLRSYVLLAGGTSLLLNLALLVPSLYMLQVFDRVFASRRVETLLMLSLFALLALWLAYMMDVARARALSSAGLRLDRLLSPAALGQALQSAASRATAHADRLRDVTRLRGFLGGSGVQAMFDAPWLPIYLGVIALMHPLLGVLAALGAAGLVVLAVVAERMSRDAAAEVVKHSRSTSHRAEALTSQAEVIVGMGMGDAAIESWRAGHDEQLGSQERLDKVSARLGALARIARQAVQMAALGVGAWLVIGADASPGIMVAATILLGRALQPVERLIGGWKQLLDARGAWQRLSQAQPPGARRESTGAELVPMSLPAPSGKLDLQRVVFAPDRTKPPLIKQVTFTAEAGESLGIMGPSGSGKTTLLRLLLGIWQPDNGVVRLDGADIAAWDRGELGQYLGYLPQDVSLFAGSVAENIARLGPVDSERVVEAAQLAHAHEMILRLPKGYDTPVGEAGAVLSGGQRQRIALARALYGQPRLVVLDEPNAHLDAEGEAALKGALKTLKARGTTVVVVGHRPGLMAQLDRIVVLKDGAVAAMGPAAAVLWRLQAVREQAVHALPAQDGSETATNTESSEEVAA